MSIDPCETDERSMYLNVWSVGVFSPSDSGVEIGQFSEGHIVTGLTHTPTP